jgi:sulfite oxidase
MEELEEKNFRLVVELPDGAESAYSLADLRNRFKEHIITATLQCSGNRRAHMNAGSSEDTSGLPWDVGGISNAEWTGVRMVDVLEDAGFEASGSLGDVRHVQFTGAEAYGASVPIEKVLDRFGDVLIVYSMNGKPLPRDHGFPLRALVPGTVAARSVKWLNRISLSSEESTSQWQRRDYKCFGPNERTNPDWNGAPAIQETPVQSAITSMQHIKGNSQKNGSNNSSGNEKSDNEDYIHLQGYAYSGGGRRIIRVDVSPDDGKTWQQAELTQAEEKGQKSWSWRRWSHSLPSKSLNGNVCVKATDDGYGTQPESFEANWNLRGNLATSWHKIPVATVKEKAGAAGSGSKQGKEETTH